MTPPVRIYHNPACSKSREALAYLRERDIEPEIRDYLATPPTVEELRDVVKLLGVAPSSLIRVKDFQRLGLKATTDREEWLRLIAENPQILVRPIVVAGDEARIANPLENLYDLFP